jgi:hypothetical protein
VYLVRVLFLSHVLLLNGSVVESCVYLRYRSCKLLLNADVSYIKWCFLYLSVVLSLCQLLLLS